MTARLAKQLAVLTKGFGSVATKHSAAKQLFELAGECTATAVPAYVAAVGSAGGAPDAERAELSRWVLSWLGRC